MISSDVVVLERGDLTVVKTKPNIEPSRVGLYTRHRKQYPSLKHFLFNSDVMIILSNEDDEHPWVLCKYGTFQLEIEYCEGIIWQV